MIEAFRAFVETHFVAFRVRAPRKAANKRRKTGSKRDRAGLLAALILAPVMAHADVDQPLYDAMDTCFDATDGGGLPALDAYGMEFDYVDTEWDEVENTLYGGSVETGLGKVEVSALMREDSLQVCSLVGDGVTFWDAMGTLDAWFDTRLEGDGYHPYFKDIRYFGLVRCLKTEATILATGQSIEPVYPDILKKGRGDKIPGALRFDVLRTSATNFDFCPAGGGLL